MTDNNTQDVVHDPLKKERHYDINNMMILLDSTTIKQQRRRVSSNNTKRWRTTSPVNQGATSCRRHHRHRRCRPVTSMRTAVVLTTAAAALMMSTNNNGGFYYQKYGCHALEATWTPADGEEGGPLPLSQNQRDQLTQLYDMIQKSSNPQETLDKIAQSNQMSSEELSNLLMRNRRDMEMVGGAGAGGAAGAPGTINTLPRKVVNVIQSVLMATASYAKRDPKQFALLAGICLMTFYLYYTAPRTGIVISQRPTFGLSTGYTTFYEPPKSFVLKQLEHVQSSSDKGILPSSLPKGLRRGFSKQVVTVHTASDEEIQISQKEYDCKYAVTCTKVLPSGDLQQQFTNLQNRAKRMAEQLAKKKKEADEKPKTKKKGEEEDDEELSGAEEEEEDEGNGLAHLLYESVCGVIRQTRFTEFISNQFQCSFYALDTTSSKSRSRLVQQYSSNSKGNKHQLATLCLKGMGDYGRYGLQSFQNSYESEDVSDEVTKCTIGWTTLPNGHFDGELVMTVVHCHDHDHNDDDDDNEKEGEEQVRLSITLVIPSKGRMSVTKKLAQTLVEELTQSIIRSSVMDTRRNMAQHLQSSSYKERNKDLALRRRNARSEHLAKLEAMEADRKRRWKNPDAVGHYRPSGHRMKSPYNC